MTNDPFGRIVCAPLDLILVANGKKTGDELRVARAKNLKNRKMRARQKASKARKKAEAGETND